MSNTNARFTTARTATDGFSAATTIAASSSCTELMCLPAERATKIEIGDFLGRGKAGPEHQALVRLFGDLVDTDPAGGFDR
jgi:hypothetical protein